MACDVSCKVDTLGSRCLSFDGDDFLSKQADASSANRSPEERKKKRCGPFEKLGLESHLTRAVSRLGFNLPTPIQRKVIPSILSGRDVVAMARTGSGKTAAFVLPILQRLGMHKTIIGIRAIILEPTRELALQIEKVVKQLGRYTDLRVTSIVGGRSMESQFSSLAGNPDIVVACPGRLMHHLVEANLKLTTVEFFVLDEADQMFELGLGEQVDKILQATGSTRQCILTSATLPATLVDFASVGLRSPHFIRLDVETSLSPNLNMWFLYTRKDEKLPGLVFLLRYVLLSKEFPSLYSSISKAEKLDEGILIFTASRHHVDFLGCLLRKAKIEVDVAYGSMDLQARIESVSRFRQGKSKVLIVTDVAARGLDLPIVGCVVNYDFPLSPKHFIHRVGRTARAGKSGLAIAFVQRDELPNAVDVLLFAGLQTLDLPNKQNQDTADHLTKMNITKQKTILGKFPYLGDSLEFVREALEQSCELQGLYRTMANAEIQYRKTRPVASRQSIKRATCFLKTSEFATTHVVHPQLLACLPQVAMLHTKIEEERDAFLKKLRDVRPKTTSQLNKGGRQGGVLDPSTVQRMKATYILNHLKDFTAQQEGNDYPSYINNSPQDTTEQQLKTLESDHGILSTQDTTDFSLKQETIPLGKQRPRMSVAERRQLRKYKRKGHSGISTEELNARSSLAPQASKTRRWVKEGMDIFDWRNHALSNSTGFFLSEERNPVDLKTSVGASLHQNKPSQFSDFTEFQSMNQAQFDIVPEDAQQQRHQMKTVRKWNAQRKRYTLTRVDATSGRVLRTKNIKQRNEAGIICKGELKKTGIYTKWKRLTHRSIPQVGEVEKVPLGHGNSRSKNARDSSQSKEQHNQHVEETSTIPLNALRNDQDVVQSGLKFKGKQRQKTKQLPSARQNHVRQDGSQSTKRSEIKNLSQICKEQRELLKKKAKQDVRVREVLKKQRKKKHLEKLRKKNESRAAKRRSLVIVRGTRQRNKRGQRI